MGLSLLLCPGEGQGLCSGPAQPLDTDTVPGGSPDQGHRMAFGSNMGRGHQQRLRRLQGHRPRNGPWVAARAVAHRPYLSPPTLFIVLKPFHFSFSYHLSTTYLVLVVVAALSVPRGCKCVQGWGCGWGGAEVVSSLSVTCGPPLRSAGSWSPESVSTVASLYIRYQPIFFGAKAVLLIIIASLMSVFTRQRQVP